MAIPMFVTRSFCRLVLLLGTALLVHSSLALDLITRLDSSAVLSESADGPSGLPQVSADGRYVLFMSGANNLVDTKFSNLGISFYVHDRLTHTTVQATSTNGGWPGRGDATLASLSADGNTVLFVSTSTNLGFLDRFSSSQNVFQKDLSSGTVTLIDPSVTIPTQPAFGSARFASMTPDARFVLFQTDAPDAAQLTVADSFGFSDVFVRDVAAGKTTLVSRRGIATNLVQVANQASTAVGISTNGNFVLFYSLATDLNLPAFTVYTQRVWLHDLTLKTNILISRGATNGNRESAFAASMSPDAKVIAFAANARLQDINSPINFSNVFVRLMESDTLKAMALPEDLKTNLSSAVTKVSPGGRCVAVTTYARISGTNQPRLFVWDLPNDTVAEIDLTPYGPLEGASVQPYFVSDLVLFLGSTTNNTSGSMPVGSPVFISSFACTLLSASADGNIVAFATPDALVPGDLNNESDVYVDDDNDESDAVELISAAHSRWKRPLPDMSIHQLQTAHGATDKIAFTSFSDSLVANDTNGFSDIFTWSKSSGKIRLESTGLDGAGANGHSSDPTLSRDGHWLAFISAASNLVANDTNHMEDVFLKSLDDGTIIRVSESVRPSAIRLLGVRTPILGAGGNYVAYTSTRSDMTMTNITSSPGAAYLFDHSTSENLWIGAGLGPQPQRAAAIYEPFVYFFSNTNCYAFNVETRERFYVGPATTDPAFVSDGSLVAFQVSTVVSPFIYTFDPATRATNLVRQFEDKSLRTDAISLGDNKLISFASAFQLLPSLDTDDTNDVYTVRINDPSKLQLATIQLPLPRGSADLIPRSQLLSRDGLRLFYLASTNSPIDQIPRTHLIAVDVASGATATITSNPNGEPAPFSTSKPTLLPGGLAAVSTARDLFDSSFDKANIFYSVDLQSADGDTLSDIWERAYFGSLDETDSADSDGDGMSNAQEMAAGTDPLSADSVLAADVSNTDNFVTVRVPDVTIKEITIQSTDDLKAGIWTDVSVTPTRSGGSLYFDIPKQSETIFFRAVVLP